MKDITHYVCAGTCGGVAPDTGVCQADVCTHKGAALQPCDCIDGLHGRATPTGERV